MGNAGLRLKRPDGDLDRVRGIMVILSALAAATLVPALLMTLWYLHGQLSVVPSDNPYFWVDIGQFFSLCFMVTALHVVLLGGPAYALLKWRNLVRWWSGVLAGFLLAVMPIAIFTWPLRFAESGSSFSANGVQLMVDGKPTAAGWLDFAEGILFFGIWGALSGLVFWLVLRSGIDRFHSQSSRIDA